jgi:phage-related protein
VYDTAELIFVHSEYICSTSRPQSIIIAGWHSGGSKLIDPAQISIARVYKFLHTQEDGMPESERPVRYAAASIEREILKFPPDVQDEAAHAILMAQMGDKAEGVIPMKGYPGWSVLEIRIDELGDTYRVVYTTADRDHIWVLHAFMKKSNRGRKTPQKEIDLIQARYKRVMAGLKPG